MMSPDPEITFRDRPDFDSDIDEDSDDVTATDSDSVRSVSSANNRLRENGPSATGSQESINGGVDERDVVGSPLTVVADVHSDRNGLPGKIGCRGPTLHRQAAKKQELEVSVQPHTSKVLGRREGRRAERSPSRESDTNSRTGVDTLDGYTTCASGPDGDDIDETRDKRRNRGFGQKETDPTFRRDQRREKYDTRRSQTPPRFRDDRYCSASRNSPSRDRSRRGKRQGWGDRVGVYDKGGVPLDFERDAGSRGYHYYGDRADADNDGSHCGVGRHRRCEERYKSAELRGRGPHQTDERRRSSDTDRDARTDATCQSAEVGNHRSDGNARSLPTHVRLGNYSGDKCLETFLAKFENMSTYLNWSEKDRLFHLKASLDGPAGQVLWDMGSQSSVDDVIRLLRSRFGTDNQAERFRAELRARRRRKGEGLQSLYNDICRLVALAFPGPTNPTVQVVGRDAFLDALDDQKLRVKVFEREPQTLEAALSIASKLEAYGKSTVASAATGSVDMPGCKIGSGYDDKFDPGELKSGKGRMQVRGVSAKATREGGVPDADAWRDMTNQLTELKRMLETGRSSWDCKFEQLKEAVASSSQATVTTARGGARIGETSQGSCYYCKAPGHYKRDCPNRSKIRSAPTAVADKAQVNGVSGSSRGGEVYVNVTLYGKKIVALLDTGCERSIIGRSLIPDVPLEPTEMELRAVNGTGIPLLGKVTLDIYLNQFPIKADVAVTDVLDDLILGIDWLWLNGGMWDFAKAELHISGRKFRIRSTPGRPAVRRLIVAQDLTVPACSVTDVPVKVVRTRLTKFQTDWLAKPKLLRRDVITARSLVGESAINAYVRVMNCSESTHRLHVGESIGIAEPVISMEGGEVTDLTSSRSAGGGPVWQENRGPTERTEDRL
jgi:hypothetical protein